MARAAGWSSQRANECRCVKKWRLPVYLGEGVVLCTMRSSQDGRLVAAVKVGSAVYPADPPYDPSRAYPEYPFGSVGGENVVYAGVREVLRQLALDVDNYGDATWNPLAGLVRPGDKVVVKPNFLWHAHKYHRDEWQQVITHGSVIRAVVDYVLIALRGRGEVCIMDGPQLDADWNGILDRSGVGKVCEWYRQRSPVPVSLLDLRDTWEDVRGDVLYCRSSLPGDPLGSVEVNLGARSRFVDHGGSGRYYGASYDQAETNFHHSAGRHEYRISRTAAAADVFINLPKMKTHKKVGVTLCLKNLVGINTGRNWLPHHTDGDPSSGGDQFPVASIRSRSERWGVRNLERLTLRWPRLFAPVYRGAKLICTPIWGHTSDTIRTGNWHGNDTAWRMVQDINRCLLYSDDTGFPHASPKRYFAVVDGIVAGDNEGPAAPDRCETGVLVAGLNPVAVDCATTRLMGFDPMRIAMLREAFAPSGLPLAPFCYQDIEVASNWPEWRGKLVELRGDCTYHFKPHQGWRSAIEWTDAGPAPGLHDP